MRILFAATVRFFIAYDNMVVLWKQRTWRFIFWNFFSVDQSLLIGNAGGHVIGGSFVSLGFLALIAGLHFDNERAAVILVPAIFIILHRHLKRADERASLTSSRGSFHQTARIRLLRQRKENVYCPVS